MKLALHCPQPCCLRRLPVEHGAELIVGMCAGHKNPGAHARAEIEK